MNIRTLVPAFAAALAMTASAAFAATPEFIDGAGRLAPKGLPAAGCKVCTVPYAGTVTTTLGSATITLTATGSVTGYLATAAADGYGGVCYRVSSSFTFTDASGKDTIKSVSYGTHCTLSTNPKAPEATDVATYTNLGGTGAFANSSGIGNLSSRTLADGEIVLTLHGTL
jgi:hypothetical protein